MPVAFLIVTLIGLAFTLNAFRPMRFEAFSVVSFFAGWLTSELPLHHLVWEAVATVVFIALGAPARLGRVGGPGGDRGVLGRPGHPGPPGVRRRSRGRRGAP